MKQASLVIQFISTVLLTSTTSVWADEGAEDDVLGENSYNGIGFGDSCFVGKCSVDEFCAHDGVCHVRTCENFYLYAPELWTGRRRGEDNDEDDKGELECYMNEYPDTVEPPCYDSSGRPSFPIAVHYACSKDPIGYSIIKGIVCPEHDFFENEWEGSNETRRAIATANRVCTAKPIPEKQFICYDIAPDTNLTSYFEQYVSSIESFEECHSTAPPDDNTTWVSYGHEIPSIMIATTYYLDDPYFSTRYGTDSFLPLDDRNMGESFDPFLVRVRSMNTVLLTTAATSPLSSSPAVWWLSRVSSLIIFVQMVALVW